MAKRRAVFDRGRDNVLPGRVELERGIERRVVRLRPATRENDFARLAAQQRRDPLAREIDRAPHLRAERVAARGIAVVIRQVRSISSITAGSSCVVALLSR